MPSKGRSWTWTINNFWEGPVWRPKTMQYICMTGQKGLKTGTPHLQGYTQYKKKVQMNQVLNDLRNKGKPIPRVSRGSDVENYNYVFELEKEPDEKTWDGKIWMERGTREPREGEAKNQGSREDLKDIKQMINEGKKRKEIDDEFPDLVARYPKWIDEKYAEKDFNHVKPPIYPIKTPWGFNIEKPDASIKKRHWLIVGPPSIGKTRFFEEDLKNVDIYLAGAACQWRYDGYEDQDIIVYDDIEEFKEAELEEVSNTYSHKKRRFGDKKYSSPYWKPFQARTMIMIMNEEKVAGWAKQEWFTTRFNTIYLKKK